MKKVLPFLLLLTFFLVPLYPAYAREGSEGGRPRPPIFRLLDRPEAASREAGLRDKIMANFAEERVKIASLAAQRRAKLEGLKDQRKAQSAIRISDTLNNINQKRTDQLAKYLTNISNILDRIQTRVNEASSSGQDITQAQNAINIAQASIADSQNAVQAQKIKDYTVSATSETTLRSSAQTERGALLTDLRNLEKTVKNTKQLAMAAASASAKLLGENK